MRALRWSGSRGCGSSSMFEDFGMNIRFLCCLFVILSPLFASFGCGEAKKPKQYSHEERPNSIQPHNIGRDAKPGRVLLPEEKSWAGVKFEEVEFARFDPENLQILVSGSGNDSRKMLLDIDGNSFLIESGSHSTPHQPRVVTADEVVGRHHAGEDDIFLPGPSSSWIISADSVDYASQSVSDGEVLIRYPLELERTEESLENLNNILGVSDRMLLMRRSDSIIALTALLPERNRGSLVASEIKLPQEFWDESPIAGGPFDKEGSYWFLTKRKLWLLERGAESEAHGFKAIYLSQMEMYRDLRWVTGTLRSADSLPQDSLLGWSPEKGLIQISADLSNP